ncbi:MAG: ComF family protein [Tepidisphaeraceae bacterium]
MDAAALTQHVRRLRFVASSVVDLCYPGQCRVCDGRTDDDSALCAACAIELGEVEAIPACERCAMPLAEPAAPCARCNGKGRHPFERIARLGLFREPLRKLIHDLKYHRRWTVGEMLADRLAENVETKDILSGTDCVVAVPLHFWRHIARGFNQSEVIARRLAGRFDKALVRPTVRLRRTRTQTLIKSQSGRRDNVRGAFGLINEECVRNRRVTIVDDVMTTGATLHSIGTTLLQARPASLCAVVVGVADPLARDFQAI